MDDFAAMQTKAKQLVQIYKPTHSTNIASAAILVHTPNESPEKGKNSQNKSNKHQLAPISPPHEQNSRVGGEFSQGQRGRGHWSDHGSRGRGSFGNSDNRYDNQDRGKAVVKEEGSMRITEDEVKTIFPTVDAGNGMAMSRVIVTKIIGTEIMKVTMVEIEVGDGMATEGKVIVTEDGEDDGTKISNILNRIIHNTIKIKTIIDPLLWAANINISCPISNTHPTHNRNNSTHSGNLHNRDKLQIYVSYVRIKATMTINANLQDISWHEHKRPSTKAVRITIKTPIKGNGQMGTMIMMIPMASLLSKGGSRCH